MPLRLARPDSRVAILFVVWWGGRGRSHLGPRFSSAGALCARGRKDSGRASRGADRSRRVEARTSRAAPVNPGSTLRDRVTVIRDPVHGDVELTREEIALVDTAEFQRLRGVKQLGFAS